MNILFVQLPFSQHLFSLFYSLAFLTALLLLIYEGYKRNLPLLRWILIITFSEILFIIGTKLFALSHEEWEIMCNNLVLVPGPKKVLYGGLLFMSLGLLIGKVWMKFKADFLDAFAIVLPLVLAIQRLGCFFAGCCYGKTCELPWAVQYPVNTLPHFHHYVHSLIGPGEIFSLPVHPSQLYESIGALLVVILVFRLQKKWKASGSSFLFSMALYALVHFAVEFFRDPLAHTNGGAMVGALNQTQWGLIVVIPLMVFLLVFREITWKPTELTVSVSMPPLPSIVLFYSFSAFLIWSFAGWLQLMELMSLMAAFVLAGLMTINYIFRNYRLIPYRLLYTCLLSGAFLLMSQTIPEAGTDSVPVRRSTSIGIGYSGGNYNNSKTNYAGGEGCDAVYNTSYFNQKYSLGGAALNFKSENLTNKFETNFGVNVYAGKHTETKLKSSLVAEQSLLWFNPYFKIDYRWVGIGGGVHLGKLSYPTSDESENSSGIPESSMKTAAVYPQAYFRIGPRDLVFLDYHLSDNFPAVLQGFSHQVGIGTGFGLINGTNLRIGFSGYNSGVYVAAYLPLTGGLIIEPLGYMSQLDEYRDFQFSLGVRYEFGQKIINRPKTSRK